jgi:hypothetical protein
MKELYEKLYYRFYCIMEKIEGESSITHLSALMLMTIFQITIFLLLYVILTQWIGIEYYVSGSSEGKIMALASTFFALFVNSLYFRKNSYRNIIIREKQIDYNRSALYFDVFIFTIILLIATFSVFYD